MANNKTISNGDLTDFTLATHEVAAADYQIIKIAIGADGVATIISDADPLPVSAATELTQKDYDSGGGTDNVAVVGLVAPASGGSVAIPGDATNGLKVQVSTGPNAVYTSDSVLAYHHIGPQLINAGVAATATRLKVSAASSGNNTLLAAQGGSNKIRVHQAFLIAATAVTMDFQDGAGGTSLTGVMSIDAKQGFVLPWSDFGWWPDTSANTLLNLNLGGAVQVSGAIIYSVVV